MRTPRATQSSARRQLELSLISTTSAGKRLIPFLRKNTVQAHRLLKSPLRELSIALVGDDLMSSLHCRFMGIDGPTDVLTFPLGEDRRGRAIAGEIIICVPEAHRQAKERRIELRREVLLYAIHGLLHLHGMDDMTETGFKAMHRKEDKLLSQLGIEPTFAPSSAASSPRKGRK